MAVFYFDAFDGESRLRDTDGIELPDRETACAEARGLVVDIARGFTQKAERREFSVDVRTEAGDVVYTALLTLSDRPGAGRIAA